jgi:hypothetical protein
MSCSILDFSWMYLWVFILFGCIYLDRFSVLQIPPNIDARCRKLARSFSSAEWRGAWSWWKKHVKENDGHDQFLKIISFSFVVSGASMPLDCSQSNAIQRQRHVGSLLC